MNALFALLTLFVGCAPAPTLLVIDLRTDLVPSVEFVEVETIVIEQGASIGMTISREARATEDYVSTVRIAELVDLAPGTHTVRVRLRDEAGALVIERELLVLLEQSRVVTVVVTRDCLGVVCPMAGDDAGASVCLGARCVPPECLVEESETCTTSACERDADCAQTSECARFECAGRVCLARAMAGSCDAAEYCSVERGCLPRVSDCVADEPCETGRACERGRVDCATGRAVCVGDGALARGEPCRSTRDACDAPESCDGESVLCPPDMLAPAGTPCSEGYCNGLGSCGACTVGAACSLGGDPCQLGQTDCATGAPVCVAAGPALAGTPCRASAGECDIAESCDGTSSACPADAFAPSSRVCRAASGVCDVAEVCTGTSALCPDDLVATSGTECRPTTMPCDEAESCDGVERACPLDEAPALGCSSALRSPGVTLHVVPVACTSLRVRAWGAGGGSGGGNTLGGAGGYATAVIAVSPGETLRVIVGAAGVDGSGGVPGAGGSPGGARGGTGGSQSGGGGGGYSGVFRGAASQANALVIAGGGAGSGGDRTAESGAGGGTTGEAGWLCTGGTQTAGGTPGTDASSGTALTGGVGGTRGGGDGGGGGGGGYFGGGGGGSASSDAGGGGGGSGFVVGSATSITLTRGTAGTPGNGSDPLRVGAGSVRAAGAVLLDCL